MKLNENLRDVFKHQAFVLLVLVLTPVIMLTPLLSSCGGTAANAPQPLVATPTYLHFVTDPLTTIPACGTGGGSDPCLVLGTLTTVNPHTPDTSNNYPVLVNTIDAMGGNFARRVAYVGTGKVGSAFGGNIHNIRRHAVVFSSNGTIVKQSTFPVTSTTPLPVQISNQSGISSGVGDGQQGSAATDLCELDTFSDFQNPDNSSVYYKLAGTDATCNSGDDLNYWMSLGTAVGDAPTLITITSKPFPLYASTGAITGFVALNSSGVITKFNASFVFQSIETGGVAHPTLEVLVPFSPSGNVLVLVGSGIRSYNPTTNILGTSVLAIISFPAFFRNWSNRFTSDADNFYFVNNPLPHLSSNVIQKISLTTPTFATTMVTEAPTAIIHIKGNTLNRIVYSMEHFLGSNHDLSVNNSVNSIAKVANNATSSTFLASPVAMTNVWPVGITADRVYVNSEVNSGSATIEALTIMDDGTSLTTVADAKWMGFFSSTTVSIAGGNYLARVVLLQRNGAGKTTDDGASLISYNAATYASGATLGTVPSDISSMYSGGFKFDYNIHESGGTRTLMTGAPPTLNTGTDIFYVEANGGNSLVRITTTPTVYKQSINF